MPATSGPRHDPGGWTAAILAGGAARRYGGRDKSALAIGGRTILDRQLERVREVASSILLVTNDVERHVPPDVRIVPDLVRGMGALGGLLSALRASTTRWTLVLGCDMPCVTTSFLAHICGVAQDSARGALDAVVPRSADGLQPLCAAYAATAIEAVERHVDTHALRMTDLLAALRVAELPPAEVAVFDPGGRLFLNINSPDDYRRVLELWER